MTIAMMVCASLLCIGTCSTAQDQRRPVIACNLKAIAATERPRYNALMKQLRGAVTEWKGLQNGYSYTVNGKATTRLLFLDRKASKRFLTKKFLRSTSRSS